MDQTTTTHDNDDDEFVVATAVAVAAEPARVRVPKPSNELLAVMTPFCQAHAKQHGKEFGAVVNDLVQWAITEAPKFNMTREEYIRLYVAQQESEEASRNQNNLLPTPLKKDQETIAIKVETTSSSCSNVATHDNKTLELLTSRLEKVAWSIESHRNVEISTLKSSLEEAREQFEKETSNLRKMISDQKNVEISTLKSSLEEAREQFEEETSNLRKMISDQKIMLDELRDWDTVNITWEISTFDRAIFSSPFNVARYTMRMKMGVYGDNRYGYLGFFIFHTEVHGYDRFPIQFDGSSISVVGNEDEDTETKVCPPNTVIEEAGTGKGWQDFVARKDLEKKFVNNGKLTLKAKIRVRRSTIANLNLKST